MERIRNLCFCLMTLTIVVYAQPMLLAWEYPSYGSCTDQYVSPQEFSVDFTVYCQCNYDTGCEDYIDQDFCSDSASACDAWCGQWQCGMDSSNSFCYQWAPDYATFYCSCWARLSCGWEFEPDDTPICGACS